MLHTRSHQPMQTTDIVVYCCMTWKHNVLLTLDSIIAAPDKTLELSATHRLCFWFDKLALVQELINI